jgi:hypothetical protein
MGFKLNPFTGKLDAVDSPNGVFEEIEVNGDITLDGRFISSLQRCHWLEAQLGQPRRQPKRRLCSVANSSVDNARHARQQVYQQPHGAASAPPGPSPALGSQAARLPPPSLRC